MISMDKLGANNGFNHMKDTMDGLAQPRSTPATNVSRTAGVSSQFHSMLGTLTRVDNQALPPEQRIPGQLLFTAADGRTFFIRPAPGKDQALELLRDALDVGSSQPFTIEAYVADDMAVGGAAGAIVARGWWQTHSTPTDRPGPWGA